MIIWTSRKCFPKRKSQDSQESDGEWQHGHDSTLHWMVNASNLRRSEAQSNFKRFQLQRKKGPPLTSHCPLSTVFLLLSCGVFHLSSFFLGLLNCRSLQHLTVRPGFMSLCLCHVMLIVFDLIVSCPFSRCF